MTGAKSGKSLSASSDEVMVPENRRRSGGTTATRVMACVWRQRTARRRAGSSAAPGRRTPRRRARRPALAAAAATRIRPGCARRARPGSRRAWPRRRCRAPDGRPSGRAPRATAPLAVLPRRTRASRRRDASAPSAPRQLSRSMRSDGGGHGSIPVRYRSTHGQHRLGTAERAQGFRRHRRVARQAVAEIGPVGSEHLQRFVHRRVSGGFIGLLHRCEPSSKSTRQKPNGKMQKAKVDLPVWTFAAHLTLELGFRLVTAAALQAQRAAADLLEQRRASVGRSGARRRRESRPGRCCR